MEMKAFFIEVAKISIYATPLAVLLAILNVHYHFNQWIFTTVSIACGFLVSRFARWMNGD
jgi:hypothetical protein